MTKIQNFFRDTSGILSAEYARSSNILHHGSIGSNREFFIENFIKKSFPSKFIVGSGEVLDSEDNVSKQADIIIYDECMPIFDYSSTKHFLSEGVFAHIEVKSNLTSVELTTALDVTKSIKTLKREINFSTSVGDIKKASSFIFAYEGTKKELFKNKVLEYYATRNSMDDCVNAICVLDKYVMIKMFDHESASWKFGFYETGADSLMVFFTVLYDSMYKNWTGQPDLNKYLGNSSYNPF